MPIRSDTVLRKLEQMPNRPENNSRGKTSKTTAIILEKIKELGKCNNMMLFEKDEPDIRWIMLKKKIIAL